MPYKNPEDNRLAARRRYWTRRSDNTFDAIRQKYFSMKTRVKNGNASICDEWNTNYESFKNWCIKEFESMGIDPSDSATVSWYNLDKDASGKGIYSPETCIFIPHKLNTVLNTLPYSGIEQRGGGKFFVRCYNGSNQRVTLGTFDTYDEAVRASSMFSNNMISNMVQEMFYNNVINYRAYLIVRQYVSDTFRYN